MENKENNTEQISTEERIKQAARKVFLQKGYAGTRTRDIAQEAGINHAMLNYYFRSKEKLFEMVMSETMLQFFQHISLVVNDETSSLEEKLEQLASNYIDFLLEEPNIPIFMFSEIHRKSSNFLKRSPLKEILNNSVLIRQIQQFKNEGKLPNINILHYVINFIGMVIFPFVMKPAIERISNSSENQYREMMLERKKLIPIWIKTMLNTSI